MIRIKKAIMHILNNKQNSKVIAEFELTLNDKVDNLIYKHITTSQRHDYRKIAEFSEGDNIVKNACKKIFLDNEEFVSESKKIANQLFDSMKGNASPANFIVCLYEDDDIQWISLLKMDFNENYKPIITTINGKNKVDIEIIEGTLPNKNQKLQKCVFISSKIYEDESENRDIFILDKQTGEDVSDYFSIDFLHSNLKNSNRDNTKLFIKGLVAFVQEEYGDNQLEEKHIMDKMWKLLIDKKDQTIGVPDLVDELFRHERNGEEIAERVLESLGSQSFDFEFIGDDKYITVRTGKRTIETGIGITLSGDNSAFTRDNFCMSEEDENGNVDIILKNVKYRECLK